MWKQEGGKTPAFELLRLRQEDQVEDGKIVLIGKDTDECPKALLRGHPCGCLQQKMQEDFGAS